MLTFSSQQASFSDIALMLKTFLRLGNLYVHIRRDEFFEWGPS